MLSPAAVPVGSGLLGGFMQVSVPGGNRYVFRNPSGYKCKMIGIQLRFAYKLSVFGDGWYASVPIPCEHQGWTTEAAGFISINGIKRLFSVEGESEYFFQEGQFNNMIMESFVAIYQTKPTDWWMPKFVDPTIGTDQPVHVPNTSTGQLALGFQPVITLYR